MTVGLAVKYRPKQFSEVVGQEHVVQILTSQLDNSDTKQGYCFTGGAGTGKTTCARLFAKALIYHDGGELVEIDAASNNGVDNVREIRDKAQYKPMQGMYKIYIIDEVHMLSIGAFNALLKVLEEPPAHVVFILCTTDPQKIPATILSRVQRFNFKRVPLEQVVGRLQYIVSQELDAEQNVMYEVSDEAYEYIAKLADGGMRDAISLLDTCLGYKPTLEIDDVFDVLGSTPVITYLNIIWHMYAEEEENNVELVLTKLNEVYYDGVDLKQFMRGLIGFVVDMRKLVAFRNMEFVSAPAMYEPQMKKLINHMNHVVDVFTELDVLFKQLDEVYNKVKYETQPKMLIEGSLAGLCK